MNELRQTETNSADDSAGRAFGLDGNLYLAVVGAALAAFGLYALLTLWLHAPGLVTGPMAALPLGAVLAWAIGLKHGKPAGYDRDWIQEKLGGRNFTRVEAEQGRHL